MTGRSKRPPPKKKERPAGSPAERRSCKSTRDTDTAPLGSRFFGALAANLLAREARASAALDRDQTHSEEGGCCSGHPLTFVALRGALDRATRGRWSASPDKPGVIRSSAHPDKAGVADDVALAVEAVNAAPDLLEEVDRLRAEVGDLRVEVVKANCRAFAGGLRKKRR